MIAPYILRHHLDFLVSLNRTHPLSLSRSLPHTVVGPAIIMGGKGFSKKGGRRGAGLGGKAERCMPLDRALHSCITLTD